MMEKAKTPVISDAINSPSLDLNSSSTKSGQSQSMSVNQDPVFKQALSDPVYSGFATWLGTILSIIAAIIAWRQARAAVKTAVRIGSEQKRNTINATLLRLTTVENHLAPLWDTTPRRGLKVPRIVADAKQECHRALGGLSKERDGEIRVMIQTLEARLDEYLKDEKDRPTDLTSNVRRELQDVTSMCNAEIERFALKSD